MERRGKRGGEVEGQRGEKGDVGGLKDKGKGKMGDREDEGQRG